MLCIKGKVCEVLSQVFIFLWLSFSRYKNLVFPFMNNEGKEKINDNVHICFDRRYRAIDCIHGTYRGNLELQLCVITCTVPTQRGDVELDW